MRRREIKFKIIESTGCHEMTSHKPNTHGYPKIWKNGKSVNAHRVLYEEKFGEIKDKLQVMHICDNVLCINMNHMKLGTIFENAQDRNNKGRNNPPYGERSGTSKLTSDQVLEIRKSKNISQYDLAKKYYVSQSTISRNMNVKRWKHLI